MLILVLCLASCASQSRTVTTSSRQQESILQTAELRQKMLSVPGSSTHLALHLATLRQLPEGAEYRRDSLQSHLRVTFQEDSLLVVDSWCDSLQREAEYWQSEALIWQQTAQAATLEEEKPPERRPARYALFFLTAGILLGFCLGRRIYKD